MIRFAEGITVQVLSDDQMQKRMRSGLIVFRAARKMFKELVHWIHWYVLFEFGFTKARGWGQQIYVIIVVYLYNALT